MTYESDSPSAARLHLVTPRQLYDFAQYVPALGLLDPAVDPDDAAVAANAHTQVRSRPVQPAEILRAIMAMGLLGPLQRLAAEGEQAATPTAQQAAALQAVGMLRTWSAYQGGPLDMTDPIVSLPLDDLLSAGLTTSAQDATLRALGDEAISPLAAAGLRVIDGNDVRDLRRRYG